VTTLNSLELPDLLANLVERSLVVFDPNTGRYNLSESMRAFAAEHLGEETNTSRAKHAEFFVDRSDAISSHNRKREEDAARNLLVPEQDNFRAALEWSFARSPQRALHIVARISSSWMSINIGEAHSLLTRALNNASDAEEADMAWAELQLAQIKLRMGEREGIEELLLSALERFENRVDDTLGRLGTLVQIGYVAGLKGEHERAESITLKALELARALKLKVVESTALVSLGEQARARGDLNGAHRYYLDALETGGGPGVSRGVILFNLGSNAILRNEIDEAEGYFQKALAGAKAAGQVPNALGVLRGISYICILRGDFRRGGLLTGYADMRRDQQKMRPDPLDADLAEQMAAMGHQAGGPSFETYVQEGKHLSNEDLLHLLSA